MQASAISSLKINFKEGITNPSDENSANDEIKELSITSKSI